jgi:hypothetical protein
MESLRKKHRFSEIIDETGSVSKNIKLTDDTEEVLLYKLAF